MILWYSKLASNTFSSVKSLDLNKWQVKVPGYGLLSLQMLFSWKVLVYSKLQALGKAQERTRRARETLSFRVSLSRAPFFLSFYFQAPATQHKVIRGRAIYSELDDV